MMRSVNLIVQKRPTELIIRLYAVHAVYGQAVDLSGFAVSGSCIQVHVVPNKVAIANQSTWTFPAQRGAKKTHL